MSLESIERFKKKINALRPLSREALSQLEAWYDVEMTYTSNALEGNTLTRSETAIVLEKGLTVRGKPLKDHEEAVDHMEALQFVRGLVRDSRPITEADIRDIHRLVVAKTQSREAGIYSSHARIISGSMVSLPSPEQLPPLMADLGQWVTQAQPTPRNAIDAHLKLVTIHPFSDGNGRTARLLMNLMLMRGGYTPMIIRPEDRPDYIDSLEDAQMSGNPSKYHAFMINRLRQSMKEYFKYAQQLAPRDQQRNSPKM